MDAHIRPMTAQDLEPAAGLLLAQLREHDITVSRDHVLRRLRSDGPVVLVADVGGEPVGIAYVSFAEPMEHEGTVAWLEELYVRPDHRSRGIGARLVDAVSRHADEHGCVAVELETKRGHERAGHLYVRLGFRDLGRTHYVKPLRAWDW